MIFLYSFNRNKCYLVICICVTEVNLKAKAEMSIFVLVKLSVGNVLYADLKKLKTDVAKMIMLNSSKLYRNTNKHKPATG